MLRSTTVRPARPLDLRRTLAPLRHGAGDPHLRFGADGVWWATRTPDGPATLHLTVGTSEIEAQAWGEGASWALDALPDALGANDSLDGWAPRDRLVRDLAARFAGVRIGRTGRVLEALVPAILEQKVTGMESRRSWRELVLRWGEPAPGPVTGPVTGLRVPPAPDVLVRLPSWEWHCAGVEARRAQTVAVAASYAGRLEEAGTMPLADAYRRLRALPGVGAWTAAETGQRAFGDPDAVSVGDFHLPHLVGWALAGVPRLDDDGMLELLEPYRGHRYRVIRLLELGGPRPPRFGPRYAGRDYRRL